MPDIEITNCRAHGQNTEWFCGAACAMMIHESLGGTPDGPRPNGQAGANQCDHYLLASFSADTGNVQTAVEDCRLFPTGRTWAASPDGLCSLLNSLAGDFPSRRVGYRIAAYPQPETPDTDEGSARNVFEDVRAGMAETALPAVILTEAGGHWQVVRSFTGDPLPSGSLTLEFLDPWDSPHSPHDYSHNSGACCHQPSTEEEKSLWHFGPESSQSEVDEASGLITHLIWERNAVGCSWKNCWVAIVPYNIPSETRAAGLFRKFLNWLAAHGLRRKRLIGPLPPPVYPIPKPLPPLPPPPPRHKATFAPPLDQLINGAMAAVLPMLKQGSASWSAALAGAHASKTWTVARLGTKPERSYHLIALEVDNVVRGLSLFNAQSGKLEAVHMLAKDSLLWSHPLIVPEAAGEKIEGKEWTDSVGETQTFKKATTPVTKVRLVWRSCRQSLSPFCPLLELTTNVGPFYLDLRGRLHHQLTTGPGGL